MSSKKVNRVIPLISATIFLALFFVTLVSGQEIKTGTDFLQPEIPQPQGFCGYCHILTYPAIINKSHETWKKSKHNQVGCVECHYPPREQVGLPC